MKKSNRTLALITSAVSALSVMAAAAPAQSFAAIDASKRLNINAIKNANIDLADSRYDFGSKDNFLKDGKCNYYDFLLIEKEINRIYAEKSFPNINLSCSSVSLSDAAQQAGLTPSMLDLTGDNNISPEDYCALLFALTENYETEYIGDEAALNIKKYKNTSDTEVVVPASLFDGDWGVILPVQKISSEAFSGCEDLEAVYLNDYRQPEWTDRYGFIMNADGEVKASTYLKICNNAFNDCHKLADIYFPQNIVMESGALNDTAFNCNKYNHFDEGGVDYYRDSNTSSPAILAYRLIDPESYSDTDLTFMAGTTSINDEIAYKHPFGESVENVIIPDSVKYIGFSAFRNCGKLAEFNGKEYSELDTAHQDQTKRFINAFDGTAFISKETQRLVDEIVADLNKEFTSSTSDEDKLRAVAKRITSRITYTDYTNAPDFVLYPDTLYNILDYSRLNSDSINSGLNTGYVVCGGFAKVTSLILDSIGIKNYSIGGTWGGGGHAFNIVYIKDNATGKYGWHIFDGTCFSAPSIKKADVDNNLTAADIRKAAANSRSYDGVIDFDGYADFSIGGNSAFKAFECSKNKQLTDENKIFVFKIDPNDRSRIFVHGFEFPGIARDEEGEKEVLFYFGDRYTVENELKIMKDPTFVYKMAEE